MSACIVTENPYSWAETRTPKRSQSYGQKFSSESNKTRKRKRAPAPEETLCNELGLNDDLCTMIESISDEWRGHLSNLDWVFKKMECLYIELKDNHSIKPNNLTLDLSFLGFNQKAAASVATQVDNGSFKTHQTALYWGKRYLKDIEEKTESTPHIQRTSEGLCFEVDSCEVGVEYCDPSANPTFHQGRDHVYLFHGTTVMSAFRLVRCGIILSESQLCQDFSNGRGFYLTSNYRAAAQWAQESHFWDSGAVVVYKVPRRLLEGDEFNKMDLDSDDELWRNVVHYNRTGCDSNVFYLQDDQDDMLEDADFVEGHSSRNGGWYKSIKELEKADYKQICILTQKLAKEVECLPETVIIFRNSSQHD